MTTRRHVLAISGSRADYSLLYWPMRLIQDEPCFRLSIAVSGSHLAGSFGNTVDQFVEDGFMVAARVPVLGPDDSEAEMARAIGRGILGFVDALVGIQPDIVLLLGDRYEIFAAAQAAYVNRIPIAHLCGGDVTNGALDDGFRHSISKMASLHFVTNERAAYRLQQLGEMSSRVFNVGSPGIDFIRRTSLMDREKLEKLLGHAIPSRFILVTFHPVTLDPLPTLTQVDELLAAFELLPSDIGIVFTFANADAEGARVNDVLLKFAQLRAHTYCHKSLGPERFHSLMKLSSAIVGNSSSGLYEAPSLDIPTVNIGRRQDGRLRAASVIDCEPKRASIFKAVSDVLTLRPVNTFNPYGDGFAAEQIVRVLKDFPDWRSLVYKEFIDLAAPRHE